MPAVRIAQGKSAELQLPNIPTGFYLLELSVNFCQIEGKYKDSSCLYYL